MCYDAHKQKPRETKRSVAREPNMNYGQSNLLCSISLPKLLYLCTLTERTKGDCMSHWLMDVKKDLERVFQKLLFHPNLLNSIARLQRQ